MNLPTQILIVDDAANRAKTVFLGNMSHELRTPVHQPGAVARMQAREALSDRGMPRQTFRATAKRLRPSATRPAVAIVFQI